MNDDLADRLILLLSLPVWGYLFHLVVERIFG